MSDVMDRAGEGGLLSAADRKALMIAASQHGMTPQQLAAQIVSAHLANRPSELRDVGSAVRQLGQILGGMSPPLASRVVFDMVTALDRRLDAMAAGGQRAMLERAGA